MHVPFTGACMYIFLSNHNSCLFTPTLTPLKETFPIRRWHLRLHQLELQLRSERHLLLQGDHLQRQEGSHKQPGLNYSVCDDAADDEHSDQTIYFLESFRSNPVPKIWKY